MTMECVKTGCHAYLEQYGEYVYGDAHKIGNMLIIRIVQRSHEGPIIDRLHYEVRSIEGWFDKDVNEPNERPSTLFAFAYTEHGYEGKKLEAEA